MGGTLQMKMRPASFTAENQKRARDIFGPRGANGLCGVNHVKLWRRGFEEGGVDDEPHHRRANPKGKFVNKREWEKVGKIIYLRYQSFFSQVRKSRNTRWDSFRCANLHENVWVTYDSPSRSEGLHLYPPALVD